MYKFTQEELELMKYELNVADQILCATALMVHEQGNYDLKPEINDYHYDMTMTQNRVPLAVMGKGDVSMWDQRFVLNMMRENDWNRFNGITSVLGIEDFETHHLLPCYVLMNKLRHRTNMFYGTRKA